MHHIKDHGHFGFIIRVKHTPVHQRIILKRMDSIVTSISNIIKSAIPSVFPGMEAVVKKEQP